MKKVLLLMVSVLMVANVAMADHIGLYSDGNGGSCSLAPGFSTTSAVIHKFAAGATGSRWRLDISLAPGTTIFSFATPYTATGVIGDDLSVGYGPCLSGNIVVGTLVAILNPGELDIKPALLQPAVLWADCGFAVHNGTGGSAYVAGTGDCREVATEQSTWGKVKALYR